MPLSLSRRAFLAAWPFLACAGKAVAAGTERLAVLDWSLAETVAALGLAPAGMAEPGKYAEWIGQPALPPGVVDLGLLTEPNLELLQQLAPDLILLTDSQEAAIGHRLRRIAPTLALSLLDGEGKPYTRAKTETLRLAERLGRPAAGQALLRQADEAIAAQRRRLAGRQDTLVFYLFLDERHGWVADGKGLVQEVLDRLGLRNAWQGPSSYWGYSAVGIDALATLDGDAVLLHGDFFMRDASAALASPLWKALPPVRAGRTAKIPRFWCFGGVPTAVHLAEMVTEALLALPKGDG